MLRVLGLDGTNFHHHIGEKTVVEQPTASGCCVKGLTGSIHEVRLKHLPVLCLIGILKPVLFFVARRTKRNQVGVRVFPRFFAFEIICVVNMKRLLVVTAFKAGPIISLKNYQPLLLPTSVFQVFRVSVFQSVLQILNTLADGSKAGTVISVRRSRVKPTFRQRARSDFVGVTTVHCFSKAAFDGRLANSR